MKNSKSSSLFQASFWIFTFAFVLISCKGGKINSDPPKPTEGDTYQEIQVLGKIKPGKPGWIVPTCCICVTEPCPCRCIPFDGIKVEPKDVVSTTALNLTDNEKDKLSLFSIKTNNAATLKEVRNHNWVGYLHNEILSRVLSKTDKNILTWKDSKKRPSSEEVSKVIEAALLESYREIGFSGEQFSIAQKLTKETLSMALKSDIFDKRNKSFLDLSIEEKKIDPSKFSGVVKVSKNLDNSADASAIAREIDLEESILNSKFSNAKFADFYQEKTAISVLRASNDFWTKEKINSLHTYYTGKPATEAAYKGAHPVVKSDASGAASGAVGGAAAGAAAGGVGAGPGAATGAAVGGTAASAAKAVEMLLDWIF